MKIFSLIPIMGYYLIESAIIAIPISLIWKYVLNPTFNIDLTYLKWLWLIWICKLILFDVYKIAILNNEKNNNEK